MLGGMKPALALVTLLVVAWLVVMASMSDPPAVPDGSGGPWFDVRVEKPRMARPLGGLLPERVFGTELRFGDASPGAEVGHVGPDRLELRAAGWELVLLVDPKGAINPESHIVFPIELGGKRLSLRCGPGNGAGDGDGDGSDEGDRGTLQVTRRPDTQVHDGTFVATFATCVHDDTDKSIAWPPSALVVRGSFAGLASGPSSR